MKSTSLPLKWCCRQNSTLRRLALTDHKTGEWGLGSYCIWGLQVAASLLRKSEEFSSSLWVPHLHVNSKVGKNLADPSLSWLSPKKNMYLWLRWKPLHVSAAAQRGKPRDQNPKAEPLWLGRLWNIKTEVLKCFGQKILTLSQLIFRIFNPLKRLIAPGSHSLDFCYKSSYTIYTTKPKQGVSS